MKNLILLLFLSPLLFANWNLYHAYPKYLEKHKSLLNQFYFKANTPQKVVALTFDDGPNKHTAKIMNVLKKYQTPATFFLIAKNLNKKYDNLYQNPLFTTGVHTYSHRNFDKLTKAQIEDDFNKAIKNFKIHNLEYYLFRPAYGVINKNLADVLNEKKMRAIIWSNDTNDWNKKLKNYKEVINSLSSGDIILMHDHATSPQELEWLVKNIQAKGYKIVPLKNLLNYPSSYPIKF
jgi:peptidoglycan/xylan/chitin deacetylase (PgdA/CDA1 family)